MPEAQSGKLKHIAELSVSTRESHLESHMRIVVYGFWVFATFGEMLDYLAMLGGS